jgi:uncharacterized protein YecA (UPF0149 family)
MGGKVRLYNVDRLKIIDDKIQKGWVYTQEKHETIKGCDIWLEAWSEIKNLFAEGYADNIDDLNNKYKWSQWITNYVQFLEMELGNAGIENHSYHTKRIEYCRELLQWCGPDDLLIANTRCAMAEAYFMSGNEAECDRLFEEWLKDAPDWALGYQAWAECYRLKGDDKDNDKVEKILLAGHTVGEPRDRYEIVAHLMALYEDTGRPEKAKEMEKIFNELHDSIPEFVAADKAIKKDLLAMQRMKPPDVFYDKPEPIRVVKIGRNEPCPCNSSKKYKKCCGA